MYKRAVSQAIFSVGVFVVIPCAVLGGQSHLDGSTKDAVIATGGGATATWNLPRIAASDRVLLAQASCTTAGLQSQCASGCSAANQCRADVISHFSKLCQSGQIDPGTAAERVALGCESCIKQSCGR